MNQKIDNVVLFFLSECGFNAHTEVWINRQTLEVSLSAADPVNKEDMLIKEIPLDSCLEEPWVWAGHLNWYTTSNWQLKVFKPRNRTTGGLYYESLYEYNGKKIRVDHPSSIEGLDERSNINRLRLMEGRRPLDGPNLHPDFVDWLYASKLKRKREVIKQKIRDNNSLLLKFAEYGTQERRPAISYERCSSCGYWIKPYNIELSQEGLSEIKTSICPYCDNPWKKRGTE